MLEREVQQLKENVEGVDPWDFLPGLRTEVWLDHIMAGKVCKIPSSMEAEYRQDEQSHYKR
jgi:hypothetical protein